MPISVLLHTDVAPHEFALGALHVVTAVEAVSADATVWTLLAVGLAAPLQKLGIVVLASETWM